MHLGRTAPLPRRPGMTMIEILVAIAIITILIAIAVVATRAALNAARKNTAKATMRMVLAAIEDYQRFWGALPPTSFLALWGQDEQPRPTQVPSDGQWNHIKANQSLAYCLTAPLGAGPFLRKPPGDLLRPPPSDGSHGSATYPGADNTVGKFELIDPWDKPYRYGIATAAGTEGRPLLRSSGPNGWFQSEFKDATGQDNEMQRDDIDEFDPRGQLQ